VNWLCEVAGVSRAGYYRFLRRGEAQEADMNLRQSPPRKTILSAGTARHSEKQHRRANPGFPFGEAHHGYRYL
jgi:hypothetical protein